MSLPGPLEIRLISGTIIRPAIMQNAPALIGDCRNPRLTFSTFRFASISMIIKTEEKIMEAQQPLAVVRFQYRP